MAATKRKVDNLLALAVLSAVWERPMHRYEMASVLKHRGKDHQMDIKWGSFYTVVQNMAKHGFLEVIGNTREGARPERVVYRITDAGRQEMLDWTRELIATATPETSRFEAGLSLIFVVPPKEAVALLNSRLHQLEQRIAGREAALVEVRQQVPRLFLIEDEYAATMLDAEARWVRSLVAELTDGTFENLAGWQVYHDTGELPADIAAPAEPAEFEKGVVAPE